MTKICIFLCVFVLVSEVFGVEYYETTPRSTTMWTPYYLSSTTSFDFNRNQNQAVQQIQESIKNPYDWQGNKNENYRPQQSQYKYPSQYFAAQETLRNQQNNNNYRLNQNREQQSPYLPPQNYNQADPKYKYEQGQPPRHDISSSVNANNQQQVFGPTPYQGNQKLYNNNQQAQHSRQPWEKPPNGGSFQPFSNEG